MVLDSLGDSIRNTMKRIANAPHVDRDLIKEVVRDIQRAMIQADVNVKLVVELTKTLEQRALAERPPPGMSQREHVIRIIYEELVNVLGETRDIALKKQRIMMVGLYGQGKTTTIGKLARFFQKKGMRVACIAGDVHRPAAYNQLQQLADSINVPIYRSADAKDAVKVIKNGLKEFKDYDIVLIDTSGRHALEDELIEEITNIGKAAKADERLLVIDAAVGQQAGPQARAFHDAVAVSGVILTKLDGTAKGGGALSAVAETDAPILFVGTGEHMEDLEKFDPARFISRMMGMGDLKSLMEKAEEVMDEGKAEKISRKILSGKFTLTDMYEQMEMLSNMGPLQKVLGMLPMGMTGKMDNENIEETQQKLRKYRVIMDSMTEEEKNNPKIIKSSRVRRIAFGAGTDPKEVKELLKYYNMSRKAVKGFAGNRKLRKQLMKQLKFPDES